MIAAVREGSWVTIGADTLNRYSNQYGAKKWHIEDLVIVGCEDPKVLSTVRRIGFVGELDDHSLADFILSLKASHNAFELLVGGNGRLIHVLDEEVSECDYFAIGEDADIALGSLHSSTGSGEFRLRKAFEAAQKWGEGTRGDVLIERI